MYLVFSVDLVQVCLSKRFYFKRGEVLEKNEKRWGWVGGALDRETDLVHLYCSPLNFANKYVNEIMNGDSTVLSETLLLEFLCFCIYD